MNKYIALIMIVLASMMTSCDDVSNCDIGEARFVAIHMEVYDSDGNNLLDKTYENNIIGSDIKSRKEDGSEIPISWTGEWQIFPPSTDVEWRQMCYKEEYNCIEVECHLYGIKSETSCDITLGSLNEDHKIAILHQKKTECPPIILDGVDVPAVYSTIGKGYFVTTFRLTVPAQH